jgi:hypothetical protein
MKLKPTTARPAATATPTMMQPLETRLLLAGHITAEIKEGSLIVTGDPQANEFTVTTNGAGTNEIKVTAAAGTTINKGKTEITLKKFTKGIRIDSGAGNDTVHVDTAKTTAGLSIITGDGNDTVLLNSIDVGGDLYVDTGAGNDILNTNAGKVFLTTSFRMGAGDDIVDCTGATDFVHRFNARLGSGNDTFSPGDARFQKENRFVDGQGGRDVILEGKNLNAFTFNFNGGSKGWNGGISDFNRADQDNLEKKQEIRSLPSEINSSQKGYYLSQKNVSDDVFNFIKKQISKLKKNTNYRVRFDVTFASNTPAGMVALGGRPADDVYLKVGGSTGEPTTVTGKGNKVRVNLDKGADNDQSGKDMTVISTAGNGTFTKDAGTSQTYKSVTRSGYHSAAIKTDANGNLWLAVGFDSDFNGTTSIYIQSIKVTLIPLG